MNRGPRALLALRALGLGDALTGLPALRALADAFPDHRLIVAMPRPLWPLLRLADLSFAAIHASGLDPLPSAVAGVDVAVNLHGRGPQSHRVLRKARPRRLLAFASSEAGFARGPRWESGEHEVERWCRLLRESGLPADPSRLHIEAPPPGALARPAATVIHPGAASAARRWPWQRWAAVACRELRTGHEVLVTGSARETGLARAVAEAAGLPEAAVLAGRTDLTGLAEVIGAAGCVACADTGVAHLATALDRPSVVVFGPVPPHEWGPPEADGRHRALWAGRRGNPHGTRTDPGLLRVSVGEVVSALQEVR